MEDIQNKCSDNNGKLVSSNKKPSKRIPIWLLIVIDVVLASVCLGIFLIDHLVIPKELASDEIVVATTDDAEENTFTLPGSSDISSNTASNQFGRNTLENRTNGGFSNYGNTNTDEIASDTTESKSISSEDKVVTQLNSYQSDKVELTVNKVELGNGNNKITYYVSDIYVSNVKYLKTAFASGIYGKNLRADTADMAAENNALLAISGDFYGNSEISVVIRNGVLYRSDENDADVCVLFTDGTMKTYSPEEFDADEVIEQGAWQAWTFGPALLDGEGNILDSFNTTDYIYSQNPRCAIGYAEPGHYIFVVVDGRDQGYSRGATLNELAQIMVEEGCNVAYNLDGGKSAAMVYKGEYVNQPAQGGRTISDIIYIGE
jgi:exopolysaccharide biosynthesis protein